MKQALIIMAKRPEAGKTKTRLCPPLSLAQAAQLYESFLIDIVHSLEDLQQLLPNLQPFFAYTPEESRGYFEQLAPTFSLVPQTGQSLGERLDFVLTSCLEMGYDQVAAINSDSPNLPTAYLGQAFQKLRQRESDVVFGPSEDGGYYLIGLQRPWPRIVRDVTMSTPTVLQDSLAIAAEEGATVELLPPWYDIDTIDELKRLYTDCKNDDCKNDDCKNDDCKNDDVQVAPNTFAYLHENLRQLF